MAWVAPKASPAHISRYDHTLTLHQTGGYGVRSCLDCWTSADDKHLSGRKLAKVASVHEEKLHANERSGARLVRVRRLTNSSAVPDTFQEMSDLELDNATELPLLKFINDKCSTCRRLLHAIVRSSFAIDTAVSGASTSTPLRYMSRREAACEKVSLVSYSVQPHFSAPISIQHGSHIANLVREPRAEPEPQRQDAKAYRRMLHFRRGT